MQLSKNTQISNSAYAGAISRYLDVTGQNVHDVKSGVPKHVQEFEQFEGLLGRMAEQRRQAENTAYDFD